MQKIKIIQIFLSLPPQKQVIALMAFFILFSIGTNSAVALHFNTLLVDERKAHETDNKENRESIKTKDSLLQVCQNERIDFVENELMIRYRFKFEIDSLKNLKKSKK